MGIQLPPETTNTSSQTSREEMEDKFTDSTGNKAATPTSKCNQWSEDDLATKVCYEALIIITGVSRYIQVPYYLKAGDVDASPLKRVNANKLTYR